MDKKIITECPFFNEGNSRCEIKDTICFVVHRPSGTLYTVEQNEQNEYQIGDIVGVQFHTKIVPGVVVHRRGKWGCKVLFTDGKGNLRCSNANIKGLLDWGPGQ